MAVVVFFVEQLASLNIRSVMHDFYSGNIINICQLKKKRKVFLLQTEHPEEQSGKEYAISKVPYFHCNCHCF